MADERGRAAPLLQTTPLAAHPHPDVDLAVLILDADPRDSLDVVPLSVGTEPGPRIGGLVQLAGYGFDADGFAGTRRFSVAEVAASDNTELIATSHGYGGACNGDSGGPALWRGLDGEVTVVGVLSKGSASCYGRERYLRTQPLRGRLAQWLPTSVDPDARSRAYEAIDSAGQCFEQTAVWLEGEAVVAEHCAAPRVCGWSRAARGHRCVDDSDDGCAGHTAHGTCVGTTALRCVHGELQEKPCGACGLDCARSPSSGEAVCAAPRGASGQTRQ